tara:strand:- start:5788 stop:7005 length:1218 start_codon:yes stop_codon:yes gene_type:complete
MTRSKPNRASITVARLAKMQPGETLWDTGVRGLCARRQTTEAITFQLYYRTGSGRSRWFTIGRWGSPWQPGTARDEAIKLLAEVADGKDPQSTKAHRKTGSAVTDILTAYIEGTGAAKQLKPATIKEYERLRDDIIGPHLGQLPAADLSHQDIQRFHAETLKGRPYLANRCLALLRAAFNKAEHLIGRNPARGIQKNHEHARTRVLSLDEMQRLGAALRDPEVLAREGVYCCAALGFMLMTGRRKHEVLKLKWADISPDMTTITLQDHKSSRLRGAAVHVLGSPATKLLKTLPKIAKNPYVFASTAKEGVHLQNVDETWRRVCERAEIVDARIHDLRRTNASHAANIGIDVHSTSRLLGHASVNTTTRHYVHQQAQGLKPVADELAGSLSRLLAAPKRRGKRKAE